MLVEDFIKRCIERHKQITSFKQIWRNGAFYSLDWGIYHEIAELTSLLDYDCRFTELGCKEHRYKSKKAKRQAIERMEKATSIECDFVALMCCCGGCWFNVGYLTDLPSDMVKLSEIASYYEEKTGFWRPHTGCALPRKYRSSICLRHRCGTVYPEITGKLVLTYLAMSSEEIVEDYKIRSGKKNARSPKMAVDFLRKELLKELEEGGNKC